MYTPSTSLQNRRSVFEGRRVLDSDWNLSVLFFSEPSLFVVLYTRQADGVFADLLVTLIASMNHHASCVFTKFSITGYKKGSRS
jgi:hypothetical protein